MLASVGKKNRHIDFCRAVGRLHWVRSAVQSILVSWHLDSFVHGVEIRRGNCSAISVQLLQVDEQLIQYQQGIRQRLRWHGDFRGIYNRLQSNLVDHACIVLPPLLLLVPRWFFIVMQRQYASTSLQRCCNFVNEDAWLAKLCIILIHLGHNTSYWSDRSTKSLSNSNF